MQNTKYSQTVIMNAVLFAVCVVFSVSAREPPPPLHVGRHPKVLESKMAHAFATWTPESRTNIWELSGLYEGDIMMDGDDDFARNALISEGRRWPKGVVPFHISKAFGEEDKKTIQKSMEIIEKGTCVRFREYKDKDEDYITFRSDSPGCWSFVGRKGGGQVINLADKCVREGVVVHELLHALGLHHQQCAANRDDYVTINWENIEEDHKHNFQKYNETVVTDYGIEYDYGSIMHYSAFAFSKNDKETITPKNKDAKIGQRKDISEKDTAKIKVMYKCKKKKKQSGEDYFFSMFGGDLFSY